VTLAEAAREYGRREWPIFPCRPRAKEPLTPHGYHDATTDEDRIAAWWRATPDANIGLHPAGAGLLVIDVDGSVGEESARRLGLFSEPTMTVATPRGSHLYFRHPGGTIGNRQLAPGLDVRADAGYVLLPPSVHPSGDRYRTERKADALGCGPPTVWHRLRTPRRAPRPDGAAPARGSGTHRPAYIASAIADECAELAATPRGARNNRLNEAAYSLARFVSTGEADPARLADVLALAAGHTGLSDDEIDRTIRSAFAARGVPA